METETNCSKLFLLTNFKLLINHVKYNIIQHSHCKNFNSQHEYFCVFPCQFLCPGHSCTWWLPLCWSLLSTLHWTALMKEAQSLFMAGWRVGNRWSMTHVCYCHMTRKFWLSPGWWCQTMISTPALWRTPSATWRACLSDSQSTVGAGICSRSIVHLSNEILERKLYPFFQSNVCLTCVSYQGD